jgi:hypothetical protein
MNELWSHWANSLLLWGHTIIQSVVGFLPRRPGFVPRAADAEFVVDDMRVGRVYITMSLFFAVGINPPIPHNHTSFIYARGYLKLATENVVKYNTPACYPNNPPQ